MLTKNQFTVLADILEHGKRVQREIAQDSGISLGSVNAAIRSCRAAGLISKDGDVTESGIAALEPYKVENAVIMAAGMSTRFAPISYERPKGVLRVKGEVLIERQIRQLQEAGINDIIVVVGYMKEQFFYLEDKFGVTIRINEEYATRNNNSTLMLVREHLGNTYVCSSDDYFTENPFEPYVYKAYYAAAYFPGKTNEYCLTTGAGGRITKVSFGGEDAYGMLGHVYFDRAYSRKFVEILEAEYDQLDTASKLWEDIYAEHVGELDMVMRPYEDGVLNEFDSLDDLAAFDPHFIENVDSAILDNICETLEVKRTDISGIKPISQGLTNLSFSFVADGQAYVYRHPGAGTDEIINRASETFSQQIGYRLGLDDTYVYENPEKGWKISRYIEGADELDYHDEAQLAKAMEMARTLHGCGEVSEFAFNVHENTKELIGFLDDKHRS